MSRDTLEERRAAIDERVLAEIAEAEEIGITELEFLAGFDPIVVTASLQRLEEAGRIQHVTVNGVRRWRVT